jgi:hypothetical protein
MASWRDTPKRRPDTILLLVVGCLLLLPACNRDLASRCAEAFPTRPDTLVQQYVTTDTVLIPAELITLSDTTVCPPGLTDSLYLVDTLYHRLPARTVLREVVRRDTVIHYVDAPLVAGLKSENIRLRERIAGLKGSRSALRRLLIALAVIFLLQVLIGAYVKKFRF